MSVIKRTVLVSGASSGIGQAVTQQLLQAGHRVIGISRNSDQFNFYHPNFSGLTLDLAKLSEIPGFAKHLQENEPDLDAVVFAAGYGQFAYLEQFSYAQIEALLTVNLTAQIFLTRALLPKFKQKLHCNLIYIGSEAALKGSRQGSIYCASKFALRGFTQALRDECGKTGVRVSLINPGMVATPFFEPLSFTPGQQPGQALHATDIAATVSYILTTGNHSNIDEINLSPASKVIEFKNKS